MNVGQFAAGRTYSLLNGRFQQCSVCPDVSFGGTTLRRRRIAGAGGCSTWAGLNDQRLLARQPTIELTSRVFG